MQNKIEYKSLFPLLTNAPIVEIVYKFKDKINSVFALCEWYSLTGSVKDKVAYYMIKDAIRKKQVKSGGNIIEVSSGNMGISLTAVANLLNIHTTILMPKNMSEERKKLLKMYGAKLVETESFKKAFELCKNYQKQGYFCPQQFENNSNTKAHISVTGKQIYSKLKHKNLRCFVCGVGTSGTLMGVSKYLKNKLKIKTIGIEPNNAQILSAKPPYLKHKIQGLSDEILPRLYNHKLVDEILQITDQDAIAMSQKLCKELSLGIGISSGANFIGCVLSKEKSVTIFADDNKKYLTTDLSTPTTTPLVEQIELLKIRYIK